MVQLWTFCSETGFESSDEGVEGGASWAAGDVAFVSGRSSSSPLGEHSLSLSLSEQSELSVTGSWPESTRFLFIVPHHSAEVIPGLEITLRH